MYIFFVSEDVYSQIASSLYVETSMKIADKNPGYNVYNLKGELVYSPTKK